MINYSNLYKYLDKCSNGFWNPYKLLTYGRPVNIVTGTRSVGKSTGIAILCLLDYLKNGHKFLYIRRHDRDTRETAKTFFSNAIPIINNALSADGIHIEQFRYNAKTYEIGTAHYDGEHEEPMIEWEQCGKAWALAQEEELKSSSLSDYYTVIYDEFISKDKNRYLGTADNIDAEWNALTSLYQTIDRGVNKPYRNEVCMFLLGNKSTIYNPICLTIGLADYVNKGAHFTAPKGKFWTWEDVDLTKIDALKEVQNSFAYQMSTDATKKYAYDNTGADNDEFISRPQVARYLRTLKFNGNKYGVFIDDSTQIMYIDRAKEGYAVSTLDNDSYTHTDLQLIHKWQQDYVMQLIHSAYAAGRLRFGNGKIKATFLKYLEYM